MKVLGTNGDYAVIDEPDHWWIYPMGERILKADMPTWWQAATAKWGYIAFKKPLDVENVEELKTMDWGKLYNKVFEEDGYYYE